MNAERGGVEGRPAPFSQVLRTRSFTVLFSAESLSIAGDELARIALAVLVFSRTGNVGTTALTFGITFFPAIVGGFSIARVGDVMSRRQVLVACNILRAGLFAVMAISGLPIWALLVILVFAVFFEPVFSASQVSYLADALDAEQFRAAASLRTVANQAMQVIGYAVGGVVVALVHPRNALLVDAASFVASALLIAALLPAQKRLTRPSRGSAGRDEPAGPRFWRTGDLRYLVPLSALAGFFIVPEGLAVPYGDAVGASTTQIGILLASIPAGGAVGALVLIRLVAPRRRAASARLMALTCGLPLTVTVFAPPWPVALAAWFVSGALAAYQVETTSAAVQQMPEHVRARWVGVAGSVLLSAQGLGLIVFGFVAEWWDVGASIATAGAVGSVAALVILRRRVRGRRPVSHSRHRKGQRPPVEPAGVGESVGNR